MSIPGQFNIFGTEVSAEALVMKAPSGKLAYELPTEDFAPLRHRDRVRILTEYVVEVLSFPIKVDGDGNETEGMKQITTLKGVDPGVVTFESVLRREDIQNAWTETNKVDAA